MTIETQGRVPAEPEKLQDQMDESRSGLVEKLQNLEHQVLDMVHDASDTVAQTFDSVKQTVGQSVDAVHDAVKDTVASARHALDIGHHVREHPILIFAGAVVLGFACGKLLPRT
ncbi:MAG TPA: hypothetical protein VE988_26545 [Gemmataceae bacterium]|nr:hypothetical protein [Gemmataceae bacterium]